MKHKKNLKISVPWEELMHESRSTKGYLTAEQIAIKCNTSESRVRHKLKRLREANMIDCFQKRVSNDKVLTWFYKE